MNTAFPQQYGEDHLVMLTATGYAVRRIGEQERVEFDTLSDAYDYVDAEESEDTKWEVVKITGVWADKRGKWAVYPPGSETYGEWTDLCDTWEQAQTRADARAHGRL